MNHQLNIVVDYAIKTFKFAGPNIRSHETFRYEFYMAAITTGFGTALSQSRYNPFDGTTWD